MLQPLIHARVLPRRVECTPRFLSFAKRHHPGDPRSPQERWQGHCGDHELRDYVQEYQAIVELMNQYNEGGKQAKSSIMKPAFSDQATIFAVGADGKLMGGPIQGLYDVVDSTFRPSPEAKAVFVNIDIGGTTAVRASTPTTFPASVSPTSSTC
jgi:Putative lumazine-binding